MRKKINFAGITIVLLALSILMMSIGFAARSHTLTINGNATIGETPKWDIHFENLVVSSDSVSLENVIKEASITDDTSTYITYDVILPAKGDFYEFTLDVVNEGTIDAKIGSVLFVDSDDFGQYIDYKVTYVDNNKALVDGDLLLSGEKKKIKIRVENVYEAMSTIEEDIALQMSFMVQYIQK